MTDSEIALLRQGQVLDDNRGCEWRVLHDAWVENGVHSAMIRCGDVVRRLTYRNAIGFRVRSVTSELASLPAAL